MHLLVHWLTLVEKLKNLINEVPDWRAYDHFRSHICLDVLPGSVFPFYIFQNEPSPCRTTTKKKKSRHVFQEAK